MSFTRPLAVTAVERISFVGCEATRWRHDDPTWVAAVSEGFCPECLRPLAPGIGYSLTLPGWLFCGDEQTNFGNAVLSKKRPHGCGQHWRLAT